MQYRGNLNQSKIFYEKALSFANQYPELEECADLAKKGILRLQQPSSQSNY